MRILNSRHKAALLYIIKGTVAPDQFNFLLLLKNYRLPLPTIP